MGTVTGGIKNKSIIFQICAVAIVVIISRLPFLSAGYGVDNDSWRFASVARNIAVTGEYQYSRAPGHPVQEYICSLFWDKGPLWLNGASALMSVLALVYFVLILKELKFKNIYLPALAFALTPIIYISSVNSMDNIWNLAFILPAVYYAMRNKPVAAGLMLGIANGCRLTSLVIALPILIILYYKNNPEGNTKKNITKLTYFLITAGAATVIFYIPGLMKFGSGLFTDVAWAYPGIVFILFRMLISTLGFIGFIVILLACIIEIIRRIKSVNKDTASENGYDRYFNITIWMIIAMYLVIFMLMPHKPSYLVPVIPFVIILLGRFLSVKLFRVVCISLIISPFIFGVNRTGLEIEPEVSEYSVSFNVSGGKIFVDPLNGPIFNDHSKRVKQVEQTKKIISEASKLTGKSVVVTGEAYPLVIMMLQNNIKDGVIFDHFKENVLCEYSLDSARLRYYTDNKYDIYYIPGEEIVSSVLYGIDLKAHGRNLFAK